VLDAKVLAGTDIVVPLVQRGRLRSERYITHRMVLSDGAEACRLFDAQEDGVLTTFVTP